MKKIYLNAPEVPVFRSGFSSSQYFFYQSRSGGAVLDGGAGPAPQLV